MAKSISFQDGTRLLAMNESHVKGKGFRPLKWERWMVVALVCVVFALPLDAEANAGTPLLWATMSNIPRENPVPFGERPDMHSRSIPQPGNFSGKGNVPDGRAAEGKCGRPCGGK